jgi:hypothetical protein
MLWMLLELLYCIVLEFILPFLLAIINETNYFIMTGNFPFDLIIDYLLVLILIALGLK